ncbi:hypothetical protein C8R45DRAFT_931556 [Mycena sanguinolenta]|nr:hypothetical protein C8R45DRAFT_931556 [Mycena sanguinolenta]
MTLHKDRRVDDGEDVQESIFFHLVYPNFLLSSIFARRRTMSGTADRFDGGDGSVGTASGDVPPITVRVNPYRTSWLEREARNGYGTRITVPYYGRVRAFFKSATQLIRSAIHPFLKHLGRVLNSCFSSILQVKVLQAKHVLQITASHLKLSRLRQGFKVFKMAVLPQLTQVFENTRSQDNDTSALPPPPSAILITHATSSPSLGFRLPDATEQTPWNPDGEDSKLGASRGRIHFVSFKPSWRVYTCAKNVYQTSEKGRPECCTDVKHPMQNVYGTFLPNGGVANRELCRDGKMIRNYWERSVQRSTVELIHVNTYCWVMKSVKDKRKRECSTNPMWSLTLSIATSDFAESEDLAEVRSSVGSDDKTIT